MKATEFLRNNETGVIFPATPFLLANRLSLGMSLASEAEYLAQESGQKPEAPKDAAIDANRLTEMVEAIAGLDRDNPKHFLGDGKPDARAISSAIGSRVTKEERDAAWEDYLLQSEE